MPTRWQAPHTCGAPQATIEPSIPSTIKYRSLQVNEDALKIDVRQYTVTFPGLKLVLWCILDDTMFVLIKTFTIVFASTVLVVSAYLIQKKLADMSPVSAPLPALNHNTATSKDPDQKLPPEPRELIASPKISTFPTDEPFASANERARRAIVNIICTRTLEGVSETTSGSGIIIDPRGFILTSAHVAHFFLLKEAHTEADITCTIRNGNPATDQYTASLVFITPKWVKDSAPELATSHPRGTGEDDFAILYVTNTVHRESPKPKNFPYVPIRTKHEPLLDERLILVGYPLYDSKLSRSLKNLYLVTSLASVSKHFTFDGSTVDVFALNDTIAAEHGISGGAVVSSESEVVGVIVTSSSDEFILNRTLNALSLNYIDRRVHEETGLSVDEFLDRTPSDIVQSFNHKYLPALALLLSK